VPLVLALACAEEKTDELERTFPAKTLVETALQHLPRCEANKGRNAMPGDFAGKVVVVTGGSRGIGRAVAQAFAREDASLVLAASSAANLAAAAETMKSGGATPMTVAGDLRKLDACEHLFKTVSERHGRCDILVNSAGATRAGAFLDLPDDAWNDGFALKFLGAVRLTRLFWPLLKAAQGHVVNVIGGAARTPDPEFLIGSSVNGAMATFNKGLSQLGKRDGVNVNAIHPGTTETERTTTLWAQRAQALGKTVDEIRQQIMQRSGVRSIAQPDDIAALAVFLCSPGARQIQGVAVAVDGGGTPGVY
jgi:NAD(P)-dependent dehydrogenase (short-subunit alcohol dehydrogenase family)